jgi:hypothetical protein
MTFVVKHRPINGRLSDSAAPLYYPSRQGHISSSGKSERAGDLREANGVSNCYENTTAGGRPVVASRACMTHLDVIAKMP